MTRGRVFNIRGCHPRWTGRTTAHTSSRTRDVHCPGGRVRIPMRRPQVQSNQRGDCRSTKRGTARFQEYREYHRQDSCRSGTRWEGEGVRGYQRDAAGTTGHRKGQRDHDEIWSRVLLMCRPANLYRTCGRIVCEVGFAHQFTATYKLPYSGPVVEPGKILLGSYTHVAKFSLEPKEARRPTQIASHPKEQTRLQSLSGEERVHVQLYGGTVYFAGLRRCLHFEGLGFSQ